MSGVSAETISSGKLFERRAVLFVFIILLAATLAGFGHTYFFKLTSALAEYRTITHVHALTMSAWILLFATQIYLVRSKNIKIHMRLGLAGIGLGILLIAVGVVTAIQTAKFG